MTQRKRTPWHRLGALTLLLAGGALLVGCGSGGMTPETPAFEFKAIGPNGGTIAAGDVELIIPAGALSELMRVSILPQAEPFPISSPDELCTYEFLGPLWCVGPVGHDLLSVAQICVRYDPALIPADVDPTDLILLIWDDALQALVPEPSATHDVPGSRFCFPAYNQLGHVAIAIETCEDPPDPTAPYVAGYQELTEKPILPNAQVQQVLISGLYIGDAEAFLPPEQMLLTEGETPEVFQPSVDGLTVLYALTIQGNGESNAFDLYTTPTEEAVPGPTQLGPLGNTVSTETNRLGWWNASSGSSDVFFSREQDFGFDQKPHVLGKVGLGGSTALITPDRDVEQTEVVPADNSAAPAPFHGGREDEGRSDNLRDIRQSPTGQHVLYEYRDFSNEVPETIIEIVSTTVAVPADGGPLVSSGAVPPGGGLFSPRFTPNGLRVYGVAEDAQSAFSTLLDGTDEQTIFTIDQVPLIPPSRQILDYVIAPDGVHVFVLIGDDGGQTSGGAGDIMVLGTLSNNATTFLDQATRTPSQFGFIFYREVVWNPVHLTVYLEEGFGDGVTPVLLDPAAATGLRIVEQTPIPVNSNGGIGHIDASRIDGRLLVSIFASGDDMVFDQVGVWLTDHLGLGAQRLPDPLDTRLDGAARWLSSWRLAPGSFGAGIR